MSARNLNAVATVGLKYSTLEYWYRTLEEKKEVRVGFKPKIPIPTALS
jgi:hypothetical protein